MSRFWLRENTAPGDLGSFTGLDPLSIVNHPNVTVTATGGGLTVVTHGATLTNSVFVGVPVTGTGLGRHSMVLMFTTTQIKNATAAAVQYQVQYPTIPNPAFGPYNVVREGSENNSISGQFPTVPATSTIYDFTWACYTTASVLFGTPGPALPITGFSACNIVFTNQDAAASLSVLIATVAIGFGIQNDQPTLAGNNNWF